MTRVEVTRPTDKLNAFFGAILRDGFGATITMDGKCPIVSSSVETNFMNPPVTAEELCDPNTKFVFEVPSEYNLGLIIENGIRVNSLIDLVWLSTMNNREICSLTFSFSVMLSENRELPILRVDLSYEGVRLVNELLNGNLSANAVCERSFSDICSLVGPLPYYVTRTVYVWWENSEY